MGRIINELTKLPPSPKQISNNYGNFYPTYYFPKASDTKYHASTDVINFNTSYNGTISYGSDWTLTIANVNTARQSAFAEWASGTTYAEGDTVKVSFESDGTTSITQPYTFKAVISNSGNYPPDDDGTNWVNIGRMNINYWAPFVWLDSINGFLWLMVYYSGDDLMSIIKVDITDGSVTCVGSLGIALDRTGEVPWVIERASEGAGDFTIRFPKDGKQISISSSDGSVTSALSDTLQNGTLVRGYKTQDGLIYMNGWNYVEVYNSKIELSRNGETKEINIPSLYSRRNYSGAYPITTSDYDWAMGGHYNHHIMPYIWTDYIFLGHPFINSTIYGSRIFERNDFDRWLTDLANLLRLGV